MFFFNSIAAPYVYVVLILCLTSYNITATNLSIDLNEPDNLVNQKVYNFDKLNDEDYNHFKSKSPDYWKAEDQETTLRQVLMIHRHGDRTPITFTPLDNLAKEPFWSFHGLGQLTNRGKARLFMLGEIMKMRYDKFFAESLNKNLRKTRSSGALRCIESAQVFLSSFLSLNQSTGPDFDELKWDRGENTLSQIWQPVSINTLSAKVDGMLNEGASCKKLDEEYKLIDQTEEFKKINEEFMVEKKLLREILDFSTDNFYKWFWAGSFLEVELSYYPNRVDPRLKEVFPRIDKASDRALALYQSTLVSKRLRSGLLIKNMIDNMQNFRKVVQEGLPIGPYNKKFVHYSAHDLNLVVLLGMLENLNNYPHRPDYASNILIELHQDSKEKEWFLRFFYMPHVPNKHVELHFKKCEQDHPKARCTLDNFDKVMQEYKIENWLSWMKECGNDINTVDPYDENL